MRFTSEGFRDVQLATTCLVLLAPLASRTVDGFDYRVLLLKRHSQSRTYDSAHVMPGGNIDPIDVDAAAWSSLFPPLEPVVASASTGLSPAEMQSLKLCAVRETFEESGLLLLEPPSATASGTVDSAQYAWNNLSAAEKTRWREEVHKNGRRFIDLLKLLGNGAKPALSSLTHWSQWITPVVLPRRFDTHFFIAVLPPAFTSSSSASPTLITHDSLVSSDGVETSSADWLTPLEAITRAVAYTKALSSPAAEPPVARPGEEPILLHPPQFHLMAELASNHRSLASLLAPGSTRDAPVVRARTVVPFTPQVGAAVRDAAGRTRRAMLLPGDEAYAYAPGTPALDDLQRRMRASDGGDPGRRRARRNRTYVLPPKKGTLGLTVEGCLRENVVDVLGPGWEDMRAGDAGQPEERSKL
ncbi:hypothetical protein JCM3770_003318 [Rhodotorula araucariae]